MKITDYKEAYESLKNIIDNTIYKINETSVSFDKLYGTNSDVDIIRSLLVRAGEVIERGQAREVLQTYDYMDKKVFWDIIAKAREKHGHDHNAVEESIKNTLDRMKPKDIILYKEIFEEYHSHADEDGVYCAAKVMNGGFCSDDGFIDFRSWLISYGKEIYLNALKNPDSLADADVAPCDGYCQFESFRYIPCNSLEQQFNIDYYEIKPRCITPTMKDEIASEIEYADRFDEKITTENYKEFIPALCEKYLKSDTNFEIEM